jgi:hypothetical protein
MRLFMDYEIKTFEDEKAAKALERCEALCDNCERELEKCLLGSNDCPVKDAIEALRGMIRAGKGIRRYKEIGEL